MKRSKPQTIPVIDERQQAITGKALNIAGAFLAFCMIIAVICDLIICGEPGWELAALIGGCLIFLIANKKLGNIQPPKSWCGKDLPTGDSPEETSQRKASYLMNSLLIGGVFALADVLLLSMGKEISDAEMVKLLFPNCSYPLVVVITTILTFVIFFGISYLINYLFHEKYELKAYRKMLSELEDN